MKYIHKPTRTTYIASLLLGACSLLATGCSQGGSRFDAAEADNTHEDLCRPNTAGSISQRTTGSNRSVGSFLSIDSMSSVASSVKSVLYKSKNHLLYSLRQAKSLNSTLTRMRCRENYEYIGSELGVDISWSKPTVDKFIIDQMDLNPKQKEDFEWFLKLKQPQQNGLKLFFPTPEQKEKYKRIEQAISVRRQEWHGYNNDFLVKKITQEKGSLILDTSGILK